MAKSSVIAPRLVELLHQLDPDVLARVATKRNVTLDPDRSLLATCHSLITPSAITHHLRHLDSLSLETLESLRQGAAVRSDSPQVSPLVQDLLLEGVDQELHLAEGVAEALLACEASTALQQQAPADPPAMSEDQLRQNSFRTLPMALDTLVRLESLLDALQATIGHHVIVSGPLWSRSLERLAGGERGEFEAVATLALHTGLVVEAGGLILMGPVAKTWRRFELSERWAQCVRTWWDSAPPGAPVVLTRWPHAPADATWWLAAVRTELPLDTGASLAPWLHSGALLGVFDGSQPTLWGSALAHGAISLDELSALASDLLPTPVSTVYPEGVSSLLAPGLPSTTLDHSLRLIARATPRGHTTVYSVTPSLIVQALEHGHSKESILQAVEPLIIGGVPASLRDLIERIGATAPMLRLAPDPLGGTLLTVSDPDLFAVLQVDRSLHTLSLDPRSESSLHTRAPLTETQSALLDAGYPSLCSVHPEITAENPETPPVVRESSPSSFSPGAEADSIQRGAARKIVQAAREAHEKGETPWVEDILLHAVSSREPLDVCVRVDGVTRWFSVEPTSVHQGRLRAKDLRSDVERTLPLQSVVEVRPVGHGGSLPA